MLVWALLLHTVWCYPCVIRLNGEYPPLTTDTLEASLRNRRQGCPDPYEVDLSDNEIEYLPETTIYTVLGGWSCSNSPASTYPNRTLDICQALCTNTSNCHYVEVKQNVCIHYVDGCIAADTDATIYRKDTSIIGMEGFTQLKTLDLGSNRLSALPRSLSRFKGLTKLELENNMFTDLPHDTFDNLTYLQILGLQRNRLTKIDRALFVPLEELTSLQISSNFLTAVPVDVFADLIYLKSLAFSGNNISSIPDSLFSSLAALTSLAFENTRLRSLPVSVFTRLPELSDLRFSGNFIHSLPNTLFRSNPKLQNLEMSRNNLSSLPSDLFYGLGNLTSLALVQTNIVALPPDLFNGLQKLNRLELDSPPACSGVRPCGGRVQVGRLVRTFETSPTPAPTPYPSTAPTTPTSGPTPSPYAPTSGIVLVRPPIDNHTNDSMGVISPLASVAYSHAADPEDLLSTGAIVGIIFGAVACLFFGLLFVCFVRRHHYVKAQAAKEQQASPTSLEPSSVFAPPSNFSSVEPTESGALLTEIVDTGVSCATPTTCTMLSYDAPLQHYTKGYVAEIAPPTSPDSKPSGDTADTNLHVFTGGARKYTVVRLLGKGRFGSAFLVNDDQSNLFVVKTVADKDHNRALKEASTLALRTPVSPHLLKILDFFYESELFCFVLNYCQGGSLQELVPTHVNPMEVERILREIATGLQCLHANEMVHRDLKPDNIFLLDATSRTVVIGDMGMARSLDSDGYYNSFFGHVLYKAPEIEFGKYSPRSDMWAVGCIGFELLSGEDLASRFRTTRLVLGRSTDEELQKVLESLPEHLKQHTSFKMVCGLLVSDPYARLTAQQLKDFEAQTPAFDYC